MNFEGSATAITQNRRASVNYVKEMRANVGVSEETRIRNAFETLDGNDDGFVEAKDLQAILLRFGYKPKKITSMGNSECEELIWTVDDSMNGALSWDDFKSWYQRCKENEVLQEPEVLFTAVEFLMYDISRDGTVDFEECMELLFRRYGKDKLEEQTNEFFQGAEKEFVTFNQFLDFTRRKRQEAIQKMEAKKKGVAKSLPRI
eukprot:CAMPEP_0113899354 /NCGR_PEP_ID=MMETSP0780_2-20120614/19973_1 /TAXON_ID=652834 /ORGANISM="Palpitomonas bilix" /LENGTH=202 /DNA_ID=CAMNT_0000891489 /DNA_START=354 /DNA_END=962 /DNA_ORIENTATION=- /assembly_acc=CAM_ASM_000599